MLVKFTKMHGLGNDFVVLDMITQSIKLHSAHVKRLSDRHLGIGCDQTLLVEPPINPDTDFYYRIYNANGQEVEQCGIGACCAARFIIDSGLINKTTLQADCIAGHVSFYKKNHRCITANFGQIHHEINEHTIDIETLPNKIYSLSIGNPHGICIVPNIESILVNTCGKQLAALPHFPHQANITFMQIIDKYRVKLRVFERGIGKTFACGSAACAATLVGQHLKLLGNTVTTCFEHGNLSILLNDERHLQMSCPATSVFAGHCKI